MTKFIRRTDPPFLKDLVCGCGKPAELAWCLPVKPKGPKKLSKSETQEEETCQTLQPYGWSCNSHIPHGV